jgi:signal transduction histidine kinase
LQISDIHKILDEVTLVQKAHAITEGITIQNKYATAEILGMYDYNQLKQVFHNIIVNAIDAMRDGGNLVISTNVIDNNNGRKTKSENCYVEIKFTDTGVGISPKVLKDVFEFYYTTKPTGTGLGLAIAKQIIEAHKGKINIDSNEGKGTSVLIELLVKNYSVYNKKKILKNN